MNLPPIFKKGKQSSEIKAKFPTALVVTISKFSLKFSLCAKIFCLLILFLYINLYSGTINILGHKKLREAKEESGLTCSTMQYICSQKVEDWRYRNEESKIITHLYATVRKEGTPCAMDDIDELHLVNIDDINPEDLVYGHRALLMKLKEWLKNKK